MKSLIAAAVLFTLSAVAGPQTVGPVAPVRQQVDSSFLHGVSDTIEAMELRFANKDAIATVTSRMSTFTSPDGVTHTNERHIRTFVLAKRGARRLIMQDQNTLVAPPPDARS